MRKTTIGVVSGQEAVLQVDHRLANFLVASQQIVVVDGDLQVLVLWEETRHLEHPNDTEEECWNGCNSSQINMCERFTFQRQGLSCWGGNCLCLQSSSSPLRALCTDHTEKRDDVKNESRKLCLFLGKWILTRPLLSLGCRSIP